MKTLQRLFCLSTFVLSALSGSFNLKAQDIRIKANEPIIFKDGEIENKTIEPSAVEPIGDGKYLLVADDEIDKATNGNLAIVETSTGKIINRLKIPCAPDNSIPCIPKNPKWEAMAKDADDYFYIIGSHAVKPDETDTGAKLDEKFRSRSHLIRFRLKDENAAGKDLGIDEKSILEINVRDFFKGAGLYKSEAPKTSRLKIEGLAIRKNGNTNELIVGLREPSDFIWVYSGEISKTPKNGESLSLKPLFKFNAGKIKGIPFQLSSIEYIPGWRGFLVLSSTEDKATNNFFGNRLWFVSDETIKAAHPSNSSELLNSLSLTEVWEFATAETQGKKAMKAEGISVLSECALDADKRMIRVAIVFDNDTAKTSISGMVQLVEFTNTVKK